jgi:glucokinase
MLKLFYPVSFEHVRSGIGIPNLYRFLGGVEHVPEAPEVAKLIDAARDLTAGIITQAVDHANRSKLCAETIDLSVSIPAGEAGNLAVKFLATGGVYLAGGVAVHALAVINSNVGSVKDVLWNLWAASRSVLS